MRATNRAIAAFILCSFAGLSCAMPIATGATANTTSPTKITDSTDPAIETGTDYDYAAEKSKDYEEMESTTIGRADCTTTCYENFTDVASILWESNVTVLRNGERYDIICKNYNETKRCIQSIAHCPSTTYIETFSSGVKYMCEFQRDAFEVLKECIDENLMHVYDTCDKECRPDALLHGFVWTKVMQTIFPVFSNLEAEFTMFGLNEACRISRCLLGCMKSRYNDRCQGVLGSLLSEVMMRPFSHAYQKSDGATMWMQYLLPHHCNYLIDIREMSEFLIPASLDNDLQVIFRAKNAERKKHVEKLEDLSDNSYRNKVLVALKDRV